MNHKIKIVNGRASWYEEIGHRKTIEGDLKIKSPHEGSWNIDFCDSETQHCFGHPFESKTGVKAGQSVRVERHEMEKKFLVIDFRWIEHRDIELEFDLDLRIQ
jgi:hypothetical protein